MKKKLLIFTLLALIFVLTACTSKDIDSIQIADLNEEKYTLDEVSQHNNRNDCWLVIENKIYDVTSYITQHPGGGEILQGCGRDATIMFQTQGGQGSHSISATNILKEYLIGDIRE